MTLAETTYLIVWSLFAIFTFRYGLCDFIREIAYDLKGTPFEDRKKIFLDSMQHKTWGSAFNWRNTRYVVTFLYTFAFFFAAVTITDNLYVLAG